MRYYSKEIPDSAVFVNGAAMRFDILETSDATLIAELDKCIARGIGGVLSITAEQYAEELKKKADGNLSGFNSNSRPQRRELSAHQLGGLRAAGESGNANGQFAAPQQPDRARNQHGLGAIREPAKMPDPIEVPTTESFAGMFSKPPTAKLKDMKATV
jgi:hypothetical protein